MNELMKANYLHFFSLKKRSKRTLSAKNYLRITHASLQKINSSSSFLLNIVLEGSFLRQHFLLYVQHAYSFNDNFLRTDKTKYCDLMMWQMDELSKNITAEEMKKFKMFLAMMPTTQRNDMITLQVEEFGLRK